MEFTEEPLRQYMHKCITHRWVDDMNGYEIAKKESPSWDVEFHAYRIVMSFNGKVLRYLHLPPEEDCKHRTFADAKNSCLKHMMKKFLEKI